MGKALNKACVQRHLKNLAPELVWTDQDPVTLEQAAAALDGFFDDTELSPDAQEVLKQWRVLH